MKKALLFIPILILTILSSCEEKKQPDQAGRDTTQSGSSAGSEASLEILTALKDSSDKAWAVMIESDDQKINDIARLLLEISYCKKYNALLLDSLNEVVKTLKEKRYTQETMQSAEIDQYDELTNVVISRVKYLARTTEELSSHPIAETLYNDIAKADNDIPRYRSMYDRFAIEYNSYLEANKELSQNGRFKKLPLFSLAV